MEATGGRTYAQIPAEEAVRATAQTSAFLQSSLFMSVLAFGLALLLIGLGVLFVIIGSALNHLSNGFDGLGSALASGVGAGREGVRLDPGVSYTAAPVQTQYVTPVAPAPVATQYVETPTTDYVAPTFIDNSRTDFNRP
jgi:hypothetical protein